MKKIKFTKLEIIIILAIIFTLSLMAIPNPPRKCYISRDKKACFSNQYILYGALEFYNMDHDKDNCMKTLDINKLIEEGYLKNAPNLPRKECFYLSKGDLSTDDGYIFCIYHRKCPYKRQPFKFEN